MGITNEYIADALNYAICSDDIKNLIKELDKSHGFIWDNLGRMEMNSNAAEAAELTPIETLCEKITNQIDALIEWKINESGRKDLESPRQAIATFYPEIPEGRLRNLSREIRKVSDMQHYDCEIRLVESGIKEKPTISFSDRGCGNAPSEADERILSLNKGNKNDKPYFMGAFGRGGSTCLRHCKSGLSIVLSRPRNHRESNLVCWTIIRKVGGALSDFKTTGRKKTSYYEMLVNKDGSIPTIPAKIFIDQYSKCPRKRLVATSLANVSESVLDDIRKGEASYNGEYGTFVKLFEFDFNPTPRGDSSLRAMASQSMTQAGWKCLNAHLFDLPYYIAITDSRDTQRNDIYRIEDGKGRYLARTTEKFPDTRIIYGNVRRLDKQHKLNKIKDLYEVERKILYENNEHGNITVRIWFFKGDSDGVKIDSYIETNKSKNRIFFTLNGQTILKQSISWPGFEALDLYYVPYYVIIQVELDNLSDGFKTDLYDSARKIFDSKMASLIFHELKDVIRNCPNLEDYENYYENIQRKMLSQQKNTRLEKQLRKLISEPGIQIFNPRARQRTIRWKTRSETKYMWLERDPPTWIDPFPGGDVEITIGERKKIHLRHNGPSRLFSRKKRCGKVDIEWEAKKGFSATIKGSTITVSAPQTLSANEEDILILHLWVGRKKYPEHRILFRAIPSSFEAVDPPTKFEIVKICEPVKIRPGATFKISITTDAYNDVFQRPNSKWRLRWKVTSDETDVNIKSKIKEITRESPRNGRMGLFFVINEKIQIGLKFVLTIQLVNEENTGLNLPEDSINCEIVKVDVTEKRDRDWYEKRKKVSSGKGVVIREVTRNAWGKPPYEDWDETIPGMIAPGWRKARNVEFHLNLDCDPYKRVRNSKDKKWKIGKEKDNIYRLLLCSYLWDYENRKNNLVNKENLINNSDFKESERINLQSILELIMLAIVQI